MTCGTQVGLRSFRSTTPPESTTFRSTTSRTPVLSFFLGSRAGTSLLLAEDIASLQLTHGSKWRLQFMPNIRSVSHNLAILKCAAARLLMPLYLFGNDIADFFNHLENAPSELPLMNLIFLGEDSDLSPEEQVRAFAKKADSSKEGGSLVFISERRMGFGIHPNSGIAQELSEAVDHIFRQRMDAVEDPINLADPRPSMQQWLEEKDCAGAARRRPSASALHDSHLL